MTYFLTFITLAMIECYQYFWKCWRLLSFVTDIIDKICRKSFPNYVTSTVILVWLFTCCSGEGYHVCGNVHNAGRESLWCWVCTKHPHPRESNEGRGYIRISRMRQLLNNLRKVYISVVSCKVCHMPRNRKSTFKICINISRLNLTYLTN